MQTFMYSINAQKYSKFINVESTQKKTSFKVATYSNTSKGPFVNLLGNTL